MQPNLHHQNKNFWNVCLLLHILSLTPDSSWCVYKGNYPIQILWSFEFKYIDIRPINYVRTVLGKKKQSFSAGKEDVLVVCVEVNSRTKYPREWVKNYQSWGERDLAPSNNDLDMLWAVFFTAFWVRKHHGLTFKITELRPAWNFGSSYFVKMNNKAYIKRT